MRTRDNLIKVHLTEDEADRLKAYADMCGLTGSALLRMLIRGHRPKLLPPDEFWAMLEQLYFIHGNLRGEAQRELAEFILRLQSAVTLPERV